MLKVPFPICAGFKMLALPSLNTTEQIYLPYLPLFASLLMKYARPLPVCLNGAIPLLWFNWLSVLTVVHGKEMAGEST